MHGKLHQFRGQMMSILLFFEKSEPFPKFFDFKHISKRQAYSGTPLVDPVFEMHMVPKKVPVAYTCQIKVLVDFYFCNTMEVVFI